MIGMSTLSLENAWIKAAVEHVVLEIKYFSAKTKGEYTTRRVEPDFYGWDVRDRNFGCWGYCRLREGNRVFVPSSVHSWKSTEIKFTPNPIGRWRELLPKYHQRNLAQASW